MPEKTGNVLNWASDIDPKALAQAHRTSKLPFIHGHVALMPDAHFGIGATVGSVIATSGAIIPAAVGVDIGCGMIAQPLYVTSNALPESLDQLHNRIARAVPAGVGRGHESSGRRGVERDTFFVGLPRADLTTKQEEKIITQLGSLGSGNHFIEICLDEADNVWVVLHSGSRGIGNDLARIHIEEAKGLMKKHFIALEDPDLAYLVEGTPEFEAYIHDMLWAQDYALRNRELMMRLVLLEIADEIGYGWNGTALYDANKRINCHHNFTQREHHHGRNVWLTRKGAISAQMGQLGVIPGSMGARSYIVRGTGNPASYHSCSHGAGRRMSRAEAKRTLTAESLVDLMAGKAWNHDEQGLLDEHPDAYKDIDQVMEDQRDLVTIEHTLTQILNYKGL